MATVYDFTVKDRKGNDVSLSEYKGKVLLIVNTATGCGFTPHYDPLEAMYKELRDKGFEILEARWLFDVPVDKIDVVVHPESIIHSMVEFEDGAVIAQMGHPDMREPIQFAIGFPERLPLNNRKLDFATLGSLTFSAPDLDRFPALGLAFEAIRRGGNIPCVLNAANEAAVAAYLQDRIGFYDIPRIASECMEGAVFAADPSLDDIFATDDWAKRRANELIDRW